MPVCEIFPPPVCDGDAQLGASAVNAVDRRLYPRASTSEKQRALCNNCTQRNELSERRAQKI